MKIAIITHSLFPENSGQTIYSSALARSFSEQADVYIFTYVTPQNKSYAYIDEPLFKEVHRYIETGKHNIFNLFCKMSVLSSVEMQMFDDIVKCTKKNQIDAIIIDHICMGGYFFLLMHKNLKCKIIYSSHNVEQLNIKNALLDGTRTKKLWKIRAFLNKQVEEKILKSSDGIICISQKDIDYFKNVMKIQTKMILSKPHYRYTCVKEAESIKKFNKRLLIVGTMSWFPNIKGTLFFVNNVFSKLHQRDNEYQLFIVGKNPTIEIAKLQQKDNGITVTGYVDDLDVYYSTCDIAIIPIFEGTGIKIKFIEAVGKRIPVIVSSFVAKDYEGVDLLVADSFDQYASILEKFENNYEYRKKAYDLSDKIYASLSGENSDMLDVIV